MNSLHVKFIRDRRVRVTALVFCCFLFVSTGWLLWMSRLSTLCEPRLVEFVTLVCSYLVQALGIGAFIACAHKRPVLTSPRSCIIYAVLYLFCLVPAALSRSAPIAIALGCLSNVFCGLIQGFYLREIANSLDARWRGTIFGAGYAASTLISWAMDKLFGGVLTIGPAGLITCCVLAIPTIVLMHESPSLAKQANPQDQIEPDTSPSPALSACEAHSFGPHAHMLAWACTLVALMGIAKSLGHGFPLEDLLNGVDLASSRLFYGAGLLAAGIVADKSRTFGALCCACSLFVPLLALGLASTGISAAVLWALEYLLWGFFAVFRVTLFADIASRRNDPALAGACLLYGRIGDAAGAALCLALDSQPAALMILAGIFFVFTLLATHFFWQKFYVAHETNNQLKPVETTQAYPSERDLLETFAMTFELSGRQCEVLQLLLDSRTNQQIASELVITNDTVKFHVRNLLKKTGCKNRAELQAAWTAFKHSEQGLRTESPQ